VYHKRYLRHVRACQYIFSRDPWSVLRTLRFVDYTEVFNGVRYCCSRAYPVQYTSERDYIEITATASDHCISRDILVYEFLKRGDAYTFQGQSNYRLNMNSSGDDLWERGLGAEFERIVHSSDNAFALPPSSKDFDPGRFSKPYPPASCPEFNDIFLAELDASMTDVVNHSFYTTDDPRGFLDALEAPLHGDNELLVDHELYVQAWTSQCLDLVGTGTGDLHLLNVPHVTPELISAIEVPSDKASGFMNVDAERNERASGTKGEFEAYCKGQLVHICQDIESTFSGIHQLFDIDQLPALINKIMIKQEVRMFFEDTPEGRSKVRIIYLTSFLKYLMDKLYVQPLHDAVLNKPQTGFLQGFTLKGGGLTFLVNYIVDRRREQLEAFYDKWFPDIGLLGWDAIKQHVLEHCSAEDDDFSKYDQRMKKSFMAMYYVYVLCSYKVENTPDYYVFCTIMRHLCRAFVYKIVLWNNLGQGSYDSSTPFAMIVKGLFSGDKNTSYFDGFQHGVIKRCWNPQMARNLEVVATGEVSKPCLDAIAEDGIDPKNASPFIRDAWSAFGDYLAHFGDDELYVYMRWCGDIVASPSRRRWYRDHLDMPIKKLDATPKPLISTVDDDGRELVVVGIQFLKMHVLQRPGFIFLPWRDPREVFTKAFRGPNGTMTVAHGALRVFGAIYNSYGTSPYAYRTLVAIYRKLVDGFVPNPSTLRAADIIDIITKVDLAEFSFEAIPSFDDLIHMFGPHYKSMAKRDQLARYTDYKADVNPLSAMGKRAPNIVFTLDSMLKL